MEKYIDLGDLYNCAATRESVKKALAIPRMKSSWGSRTESIERRVMSSERTTAMFLKGVPFGIIWIEDNNGVAELFNYTTSLVDTHKVGYVKLFKAGAPDFISRFPERYRKVMLKVVHGDTATLNLYLHYVPNAKVVRMINGYDIVEADIEGRNA